MKRIDISILIPTRNEVKNIERLILEILDELNDYKIEIIVVDDASEDGTAELVKIIVKKHREVKFIRRHSDPDLGRSILMAVNASAGEYIIGMDADFNHHPKYLKSLVEKCDKSKMVVGSRFVSSGGMEYKLRYWLSLFFNILLKFGLGFPIWDNTSGYYCITRNDLISLNPETIFYGYGEYFIRLVAFAKKSGMKIIEFPVFYPKRTGGKSKSKFWQMLLTYGKVANEVK